MVRVRGAVGVQDGACDPALGGSAWLHRRAGSGPSLSGGAGHGKSACVCVFTRVCARWEVWGVFPAGREQCVWSSAVSEDVCSLQVMRIPGVGVGRGY